MTQIIDLYNLVIQESNQENSSFVSQNEVIRYINNGLAEMYGKLITAYEDYDSNTYTVILNGQSNEIPIPSDCKKVRLVEYQFLNSGSTPTGGTDADNFYPINQFTMPQRNRYGANSLNIFMPYLLANVTYRVMGSNILIEPVISAGGTYRIWYVKKWKDLLDPTDFLPDIVDDQNWWEYAVVYSCIKIYSKMGQDVSGLMAQKAELKDNIISECKNRSLGGPKLMTNIRKRSNGIYGIGAGLGSGSSWW